MLINLRIRPYESTLIDVPDNVQLWISLFSKIQLVVYYQYCVLIG